MAPGHARRVEVDAAAEQASIGDARDAEPDVRSEHCNRPNRDNGSAHEAECAGRAWHVGDEPANEMLPLRDAVHDARPNRTAHELERALLPRLHLLRSGLLRDQPKAILGRRHVERQPHEHHPDLVGRCSAALQRDRHGDGQPCGDLLTGCWQRRSVTLSD